MLTLEGKIRSLGRAFTTWVWSITTELQIHVFAKAPLSCAGPSLLPGSVPDR
jgi:hypothetical protein